MSDEYRVTRDGRELSAHASYNDAWIWLLGHQPQSTDWAMRYEGYAIERVGE